MVASSGRPAWPGPQYLRASGPQGLRTSGQARARPGPGPQARPGSPPVTRSRPPAPVQPFRPWARRGGSVSWRGSWPGFALGPPGRSRSGRLPAARPVASFSVFDSLLVQAVVQARNLARFERIRPDLARARVGRPSLSVRAASWLGGLAAWSGAGAQARYQGGKIGLGQVLCLARDSTTRCSAAWQGWHRQRPSRGLWALRGYGFGRGCVYGAPTASWRVLGFATWVAAANRRGAGQ